MTSIAQVGSHPASARLPNGRGRFLEDLLAGLSSEPKMIPSKYFYDERGSRLFDEITALPEYYLTRTELEIMTEHMDSIADHLGPRVVLIEYGSGSSIKTRMLLDRLGPGSAYVPIDISGDYLHGIAAELARDYPEITVVPVHADYSQPVDLPPLPGRKVVYYPGSTIGNFEPQRAQRFLTRLRSVVGDDGAVLLGVDMKKDRRVLEAAYDDARGVTAEFNKNVLRRANRELGTDFDLDQFDHRAVYNEKEGRIEMHLVSRMEQQVRTGFDVFYLSEGEYIHTENSYKYQVEDFDRLVSAAGFAIAHTWLDRREWFCIAFLTACSH